MKASVNFKFLKKSRNIYSFFFLIISLTNYILEDIMAVTPIPNKEEKIIYNPSTAFGADDTQRNDFVDRDVWYHHYFTAISFKVNIWAQYYFFGSEHLNIQLYKYSISQKKWVLVKEYADLYGGYDAIGNGKWGRISVNSKTASTGGDFVWNLEDTDAIHWDVAIRRFKGVKGGHSSRIHLITGNYSTLPQSVYDTICKGDKIIKFPKKNYNFYVTGNQPTNPFNEPWGNVTLERGSRILNSDYLRLLPSKYLNQGE